MLGRPIPVLSVVFLLIRLATHAAPVKDDPVYIATKAVTDHLNAALTHVAFRHQQARQNYQDLAREQRLFQEGTSARLQNILTHIGNLQTQITLLQQGISRLPRS